MSLIKCKECGKEISNEAINCPHCGYSFNNKYIVPSSVKVISFFIPINDY